MKSWKRVILYTGIAGLIFGVLGTATALADGPTPWSKGGWGTSRSSAWGMMGGNGGMMGGYGGTMGGNGGMMGGYGGMMGGYGGIMGGYGFNSYAEPVSIEQAEAAVEAYLEGLGNANLEVAEVMVFSNHSYAQVVEKDSGIGAFELLVDHATLTVYPEMGPNMMWNLKYGHSSGAGFGACHGASGWSTGGYTDPEDMPAVMPVTAEEAVRAAQRYLDAYLPGTQADQHADPFYGYYTIHTLRNGETVGMLSVNGYTGRVFYHSWHGDLLDMDEHGDGISGLMQ